MKTLGFAIVTFLLLWASFSFGVREGRKQVEGTTAFRHDRITIIGTCAVERSWIDERGVEQHTHYGTP